jgi:hypothetical protein
VIAEKGKPAPLQATKRWMVERTNSWNNTYKKLVWCTERRERVIDPGSLSRTRASSWAGSSEKPGLGTVGRPVLLADRDLLARPLLGGVARGRSEEERAVALYYDALGLFWELGNERGQPGHLIASQ